MAVAVGVESPGAQAASKLAACAAIKIKRNRTFFGRVFIFSPSALLEAAGITHLAALGNYAYPTIRIHKCCLPAGKTVRMLQDCRAVSFFLSSFFCLFLQQFQIQNSNLAKIALLAGLCGIVKAITNLTDVYCACSDWNCPILGLLGFKFGIAAFSAFFLTPQRIATIISPLKLKLSACCCTVGFVPRARRAGGPKPPGL